MTPQTDARSRICFALAVTAFVFGLAAGCASGQTSTADDSKPAPAAERPTGERPTYGDDPMGVARRWASELPIPEESAAQKTLADGWVQPTVARLVRHPDGFYTAIVTEAGGADGEAIELRIEQADDEEATWKVTDTDITSSRRFWPSRK